MSRLTPSDRETVQIIVEGVPRQAPAGASVAAALFAIGYQDVLGAGTVFCGMGSCYGCVATVDGRPGVRTCVTPVRDGMRVGGAGRRVCHG